MTRTLRMSSALLVLSLCSLVFASPNARLRFQARSFANSSTQTSTLSSSTVSSSSTTTWSTTWSTTSTSSHTLSSSSSSSSSTDSTITSFTSTTTTYSNTSVLDLEFLEPTTIIQGNTTIVGLPGPTITTPPNFDLTGLGQLDPALSSYIVENNIYSIDWADFIGFKNGSLIFKHPDLAPNATACPTFWVFPDEDEGDFVEIVTVMATSSQFCQTATLTLPPPPPAPQPLIVNGTNGTVLASSVLESTVLASTTSATKKVSTVYAQQPFTTPDFNSAATHKFTAVAIATASVDFGTPAQPIQPTQAIPGKVDTPSGVNNIDNAIASAIAHLFPDSSPSNGGPGQPKNSGSPGDNGSGAVISNILGAYIASALSGGTPGQINLPPQQGQVNGISYSVGPTAIVVNGKTYSPAAPTTIALPNGQTANIGPNGLTINNNFIPINSDGSTIQNPTSGSFNGVSYTITPGGSIVINGQTLSPSSPTSITLPGGQIVSIGPNGLVVDGTLLPLGLGPVTKMPLGLGLASATTTGPVTTSRSNSSGTASSTGSTSSKTTTITSSTATTSSASKTATTTSPKKAAAPGDKDPITLGTVLIVGLSSVLIAWL
ncbi:hypothetical protein FGG08_005800 [Glutinoglossum americanum]|uniref:Uncharacterized protein n=1 Tax=Glutinoglossum americanum TaxID=1670608 RepID=A0A9P8I2A7_9PEZI|nr:hypothetical protein FGG08_005800 [Glutinoglossum americanum]